MRTRSKILKLIEAKKLQIKALNEEIFELKKEDALLCDKNQWFTEQDETTGRGKKKETHLVGRVHFKQRFMDVDTNKTFLVERTKIAKIDSNWMESYFHRLH